MVRPFVMELTSVDGVCRGALTLVGTGCRVDSVGSGFGMCGPATLHPAMKARLTANRLYGCCDIVWIGLVQRVNGQQRI